MKYVFVLILFAVVAGLIYWRLRPYILMVRRFLGVVREVNRAAARDLPRREPAPVAHDEKLVRCASCGTWMPAARSVKLRATNTTYCSHACLERSAAPPRARRSAG